jgi:hypothetical protein
VSFASLNGIDRQAHAEQAAGFLGSTMVEWEQKHQSLVVTYGVFLAPACKLPTVCQQHKEWLSRACQASDISV